MRWTRRTIVDEIRRLHEVGTELNYAAAEANHLNLVRAGAWHFGTWRQAVESAGINYNSIARYQRWDRERIVQRIQELHAEGADLSWRAVSTAIDPPLAAAALRSNGFNGWREAITAAGLDIDVVARYKYWTPERVVQEIRALQGQQHLLSSKVMQDDNQALFCAARRRFGSWDEALAAAGQDVDTIRRRRAPRKVRQKARTGSEAAQVDAGATASRAAGVAPGRGRKVVTKGAAPGAPRALNGRGKSTTAAPRSKASNAAHPGRPNRRSRTAAV